MPPNFSQYINPVRYASNTHIDLGQPFRQLADFMQRQKQQDDLVSHQNRIAGDVNTRFAIEQGEKTTGREFEYAQAKKAHSDKLLAAARTAVSQGNWNAADALIGPLAELGVKVDRQKDAQGRPVYRFQAPEFSGPTGETYESAAGKLRVPGVTAPVQVNQKSPDTTRQDRLEQPQTSPQPVPTRSESAEVQADQVNQSTQESTRQSPFDPFQMDAGEFQRINSMRLDPVLKGIESGFPNRFQPLVGSYLESLKSLNMPPEATLEAGQKPLDTMSRLYGAELNAEGQMARAGVSAGAGAASEARLRQEAATNHAIRIATQYNIPENLEISQDFDLIRQGINSGNPAMVANAVKKVIGMTDGKKITDQDFKIGVVGLASNITELTNQIQRIYIDGLPPNQVANFNQMLDLAQAKIKRSLRFGVKQLGQYAKAQRYEPAILGIREYIQSLPPEFLSPEDVKFDPLKNQGGMPARTSPTSNTSKSVAVPAGPNQDAEAEELLKSLGQ